MQLRLRLVLALLPLVLCACAGPKTTDEFVKDYGDSMWVDHVSFDLEGTSLDFTSA